MQQFTFDPIGPSYLLVVVCAVVLLGLLAIRPGGGRLDRSRRMLLAALRIGVIALILLIMLRPTMTHTKTTLQQATLVVLGDGSRSMMIADETAGRTRHEAMVLALEDAAETLGEIQEDFEVVAYVFDESLRPVEVDQGRIDLGASPEGDQTALGSALRDILREHAGKRLLGVLVLSDGTQRAWPPRDALPQTVASEYKAVGFPLYCFPLGKPRGEGQGANVAVTRLTAEGRVFVKNALAVRAEIRVDGYVNEQVTVRLLAETSPGAMEAVDQAVVDVAADGERIPLEFRYVPELPGEIKLTVVAEEKPGERAGDNEVSTFVQVLPGGLNVLYLEGALRPEARYLRWAWDASEEIDVDYLRLEARAPRPAGIDLAERLVPGAYAVYVLGDLDVKGFREGELEALAEAVDRGAGLLTLGGVHSYGPGGYAKTPLAGVLPIRLDANERQNFDEAIRDDRHVPGPLRMAPTPAGMAHFVMSLGVARGEVRQRWAKLPPLESVNRFDNLKTGALVLAEAESAATHNAGSNRAPLLVSHTVGAGRVLAFAGDSTWLWRLGGFDQTHKRFWRQVVLWLARKDESLEGRVWIRLAQRRFTPHAQVEFAMGASTPGDEPAEDAVFEAELVLPDGSKRPLAVASQGAMATASTDQTGAAGDYAIQVRAMLDGESLGSARARFVVVEQDLELDQTAADPGLLDSLASVTKGESHPPEEMSKLVRRLADEAQLLQEQTVTRQTLWDRWYVLIAVVGLLAMEWYLRKRWRLV